MMYATHMVREEKGREVCRRLDYGLCRVRLPDHPDVPLWLVVVRGLGARPMMLLTPMRRNHKVLWWAVSTYLSRWRIEEAVRFIKQSYKLQDIRVLSYERLRNMAVLVNAAAFFTAVVLGTRIKLDILASRLLTATSMRDLAHLLRTEHLALVAAILDQRPFLTMTELAELLGQSLDQEQQAELYLTLFVPMNLNTTPEEVFELVPGVGPRLAHEFEEYRPYQAIEQFRREIGKYVDQEEVARLEQFVFVPINLNTASDQEILSIPGVGERLLHEFKEYRPYESIEQFRREIGKYVDDKEISRLERFVTL